MPLFFHTARARECTRAKVLRKRVRRPSVHCPATRFTNVSLDAIKNCVPNAVVCFGPPRNKEGGKKVDRQKPPPSPPVSVCIPSELSRKRHHLLVRPSRHPPAVSRAPFPSFPLFTARRAQFLSLTEDGNEILISLPLSLDLNKRPHASLL